MGFQYTKLYRRFEVDLSFTPTGSTGRVYWEFRTERPGEQGVQDRQTGWIEMAAGETNRKPVRINLPGAVRGRMCQIHLQPARTGQDGEGQLALFGIRVYAKLLHPHENTTWQWYPVEMRGTSEVWSEVRIPIRPTSNDWSETPVAMRPTSDDWSESRVPIRPTPDDWQEWKWPFRETPIEPGWAQLPVDE
jgi:hypothetical protein